ncbi:MAG: DUF4936 family protein [Pseudomonadota bacterium]|nr:DUF4936 family protein [Pseudomonadota bacterium]
MSRQKLFIYWRCDPADEAEALRAAAQMQGTLRLQHPGLQTRLYRRTGDTAGDGTVMERYAMDATDVDAALWAAIEAAAVSALSAWCRGPRHVEAFEVVEPSAD